jgi:hypothetical protein
MTQGFLTLRPLISIIASLWFVASAKASSFKPTSSDISLFFEIFRLSIPLLDARALAKS